MGVAGETLIISLIMAVFGIAPHLIRRVRDSSQSLLLVGTGALVGIYFFDLLPDVLEVGGRSSLLIVGIVWALYSVVHTFHLHQHQHEEEEYHATHQHQDAPVGLLMAAMLAHCVTSGIFLSLSQSLSVAVEHSFFLALLAHKGFEALSFSLILRNRVGSIKQFSFLMLAYSFALPFGAGTTYLLMKSLASPESAEGVRTLAIITASVASGSLLGCMIHDFVIPTFRKVRHQKSELAWVAAGLLMTLGLIFFSGHA